ncbi:MAG: hypothetical protein ACMV1B_03520 [Prevotella sp.]
MKKLDEFLLVVYFTNFKITHFPKKPLGLTILNNLNTTIKNGNGYGYGNGEGNGNGYGYGSGYGYGDGEGNGSGDGYGDD